jgi:hypothetical protein
MAGAFNDPDMLIVGNTPCSAVSVQNGMHCGTFTTTQEQTQMALWAVFAAPLLMSNDLRAVPASSRAILQNPEVSPLRCAVCGPRPGGTNRESTLVAHLTNRCWR